jgi:hypothetical protein
MVKTLSKIIGKSKIFRKKFRYFVFANIFFMTYVIHYYDISHCDAKPPVIALRKMV